MLKTVKAETWKNNHNQDFKHHMDDWEIITDN